MEGGHHYPGISGLRIPHFVPFMLDMTDRSVCAQRPLSLKLPS